MPHRSAARAAALRAEQRLRQLCCTALNAPLVAPLLAGELHDEAVTTQFGPHLLDDVLRVPREVYFRHPIYNEILRPSGCHTFIRLLLRDHGRPVGTFTIGRCPGAARSTTPTARRSGAWTGALGVSRNTVVYHRRQLYNRFDIDSRAAFLSKLDG